MLKWFCDHVVDFSLSRLLWDQSLYSPIIVDFVPSLPPVTFADLGFHVKNHVSTIYSWSCFYILEYAHPSTFSHLLAQIFNYYFFLTNFYKTKTSLCYLYRQISHYMSKHFGIMLTRTHFHITIAANLNKKRGAIQPRIAAMSFFISASKLTFTYLVAIFHTASLDTTSQNLGRQEQIPACCYCQLRDTYCCHTSGCFSILTKDKDDRPSLHVCIGVFSTSVKPWLSHVHVLSELWRNVSPQYFSLGCPYIFLMNNTWRLRLAEFEGRFHLDIPSQKRSRQHGKMCVAWQSPQGCMSSFSGLCIFLRCWRTAHGFISRPVSLL